MIKLDKQETQRKRKYGKMREEWEDEEKEEGWGSKGKEERNEMKWTRKRETGMKMRKKATLRQE